MYDEIPIALFIARLFSTLDMYAYETAKANNSESLSICMIKISSHILS